MGRTCTAFIQDDSAHPILTPSPTTTPHHTPHTKLLRRRLRWNPAVYSPRVSMRAYFTYKKKGCSRVVTGPAGPVRRFPQSRRSRPIWSRGARNLTGWIGADQEVLKPHGSGRFTMVRPGPRKLLRPVENPVKIDS